MNLTSCHQGTKTLRISNVQGRGGSKAEQLIKRGVREVQHKKKGSEFIIDRTRGPSMGNSFTLSFAFSLRHNSLCNGHLDMLKKSGNSLHFP
jgi:hypothetical protein